MEQRRLRLGDILDDYCPRERRVTNHAVVAMIEDDIKQTRCTTCDTEHAYKGARVPKRRKKDTPSTLYSEVLAGMPDTEHTEGALVVPETPQAEYAGPDELDAQPEAESAFDEPAPEPHDDEVRAASEESREHDDDQAEPGEENVPAAADGPVHRRLIRATLPRPEGQKDARPLPEFTVRQTPARANGHGHNQGHGHSGFRGERMKMRGGGSGHGHGNGNRPHGGGSRFQGPGNRGSGRGNSPGGFRNGNGGQGGKRGRGPRG